MQDVEAEAEKLRAVLGGKVDVTLDCAGFTKTMQTALAATKSGGRVCLVGMGHTEMTLPLTPAAARSACALIVNATRTSLLCLLEGVSGFERGMRVEHLRVLPVSDRSVDNLSCDFLNHFRRCVLV
jgi:hypothetical protein